ncbi:MAG: hypothetical protein ACJ8ER_01375 [Allosphingosinicella sp.]
MGDAQAQLDGFLAKFSPEVEAQAHDLVARMRARLPGATIMVYDNYNALAIGFGASGKVSRAVLSLAVFPRWVTLCFLFGAGLPDPHGLLSGKGSQVRHIRLADPALLDDPRVQALIDEAVARSEPPFDPAAKQELVIKSVSAKQRPRR